MLGLDNGHLAFTRADLEKAHQAKMTQVRRGQHLGQ